MKVSLYWLAGLMVIALFWYGYTYSLTAQVFMIQGYIGALIPTVIGVWLFACGIVVGMMS